MFKELRKKFLMLNLVIITIMMLITFITIYLITYNNVRRDIDLELHKISEIDKRPKDPFKGPQPNLDNAQPPMDRSLSFTLNTDKEGNIISSFSIFNLDKEFYENAKKEVFSKVKDKGNLKLDGTHWAFIKLSSMNGYKIVFLDTTKQQWFLLSLIYTFLAVAFVMFIGIFFISSFFANKSITPIKEAFDKQKQFVADASHELKTPLAVINTNIDLLLSNGQDTINNQSKWLYYIKSEVQRMTKLTKDLLYLTQVDYSEVKMIFSDFNFSEVVESVILTMEAIIFENNISLDYSIEPNLLFHGNSEELRQVIMILIDNALKYTNPKGNVSVTLKTCNSNIHLTVTNSGEGILPEYIDRIFDRFYRVDKSRSRNSGGYGLGLPIAKAIVEQHGGKISVQSLVGESTTFTIELPAKNHSKIY